jgi:hypothetical protein
MAGHVGLEGVSELAEFEHDEFGGVGWGDGCE